MLRARQTGIGMIDPLPLLEAPQQRASIGSIGHLGLDMYCRLAMSRPQDRPSRHRRI